MMRKWLSLALVATLAACIGGGDSSPPPKVSVSSSDHRPAKELFGPVALPSSQTPESFGSYSQGCLAGAVALPENGPTWQAMRLSRNRNWGQPVLVDFLEDLSRKAAASDPRVARIFVFPGAKVQMCNDEKGDKSWLRKVRPWWGHHYHFHVRLNCPRGDQTCVDQAPPPPGDGCADAQEWVNNILNPPPPDPNAKPAQPKPPITLASLPAQCSAVLSSR